MNEIARAAWSHTHTDIFRWQASRHCFRASGGWGGSEGIARGPWAGTRIAISRWQAARHRTQNDLRGREGDGRRPRVAFWLVRGAFGEAAGPPPPTVSFSGGAAVDPGPRGVLLAPAQRFRGCRWSTTARSAICQGEARSVAARSALPHRTRTRPIDVAPIVVTRPAITRIVGPPLLSYPVSPPRRSRLAPTFPVLGLRRTIRAPAPLCLLPHHFYDPHPCVPFSTTTCLRSPATHPSAVGMELPRRGCPALPLCCPRTMAPSFALRFRRTWACCC